MEPPPKKSNQKNPARLLRLLLLVAIILALISLYTLNASTPGHVVMGCMDGCATHLARNSGPIRVVSLNMLHGFPNFKDLPTRLDLISGELKRIDADVVLLQEVPWTIRTGYGVRVLAEQLGFNYLYFRASGNHSLIFFEEGEAILSRFPLKNPHSTSLSPRVSIFEKRVSLAATAVTPGGEVTFFVTHLTDKDPQARIGEARALEAFVSAYAGSLNIIAGDFNAQETTPPIELLSQVWMDTYRSMHPADPGLTCCIDDLHSGGGEPLEERIDYIFMTGNTGNLVSAKRVFDHPFETANGWQWASDHIGLMVEISP